MDGAYGKLPNDRTPQINAYGFYNVLPEWTVGGNALIAAGPPLNCIGNHPTDTSYGSNYFWCNGVRVDRGSKGNLPWARSSLHRGIQPQVLIGFDPQKNPQASACGFFRPVIARLTGARAAGFTTDNRCFFVARKTCILTALMRNDLIRCF